MTRLLAKAFRYLYRAIWDCVPIVVLDRTGYILGWTETYPQGIAAHLERYYIRKQYRGCGLDKDALKLELHAKWVAAAKRRGAVRLTTRVEKKRKDVSGIVLRLGGYKLYHEDLTCRYYWRLLK